MVTVIIIWFYMTITFGILGIALLELAGRAIDYKCRDIMPIFLAGMLAATWYAEVFSLFGPVSLGANILLVIICVFICLFLRRNIIFYLKKINQLISNHRVTMIVAIILAVLFAYGTSHGLIHYDTGLYHAQAIRWIEEYGIVPGLGNLHTRLAYNSAAFPLTALYSFAFLGGRSFHVTSGYCALLLALECLGLNRNIIRKHHEEGAKKNTFNIKLTVSAFARFMGIYYLLMIYDEMISPASDYYMVCVAFILFIRLLDSLEADEFDANRVAMLTLFAAYILTVKLSGAFLVLIALIPIIYYIRSKSNIKLVACVASGAVIILPYVVRNFILSGWLLYPSTAFHFWDMDWQIPKDIAVSDYKEIQVYGRGYTDIGGYERSIAEWFGNWFGSQSIIDRLFIIAAIGAVAYFVIKCIYYGLILFTGKKRSVDWKMLYAEGVICTCFIFWLFTSPLMRYGCLFVYLTAAVIWGRCLLHLIADRKIINVLYVFILVVGLYKAFMFGKEFVQSFRSDTLIVQQDYDNFDVFEYEIEGVKLYAPVSGDRVGYDAFPSSPWEMDIHLRGDDIKSGFKAE